jgi:predicted DNA-binding ribbon-helix-helix protein
MATEAPAARHASGVVKYSLSIAGHRTSVSLEPVFWERLGDVARGRALSLAALITEIDRGRAPRVNLSSAIRVFLLSEALERPTTTGDYEAKALAAAGSGGDGSA